MDIRTAKGVYEKEGCIRNRSVGRPRQRWIDSVDVNDRQERRMVCNRKEGGRRSGVGMLMV